MWSLVLFTLVWVLRESAGVKWVVLWWVLYDEWREVSGVWWAVWDEWYEMSREGWVVWDEWVWDEWCEMSGVRWVAWDESWEMSGVSGVSGVRWVGVCDECCVMSGVRWVVCDGCCVLGGVPQLLLEALRTAPATHHHITAGCCEVRWERCVMRWDVVMLCELSRWCRSETWWVMLCDVRSVVWDQLCVMNVVWGVVEDQWCVRWVCVRSLLCDECV